ncbi:MAG: serine protease [Planctomycetaceae bacterium]
MEIREIVEGLVQKDNGIDLAFRQLKSRARRDFSMRTATITGLAEWGDLATKKMKGTVTSEGFQVGKAQLVDRALMIADRLDSNVSHDADLLIGEHQRLANELQGKTDAVEIRSILESAANVTTFAEIAIARKYFSLSDAIKKMLELRGQICAIIVQDRHIGTGFLITDRHIISNYHVLSAGLSIGGPMECVFDFVGDVDFKDLPRTPLGDIPQSGDTRAWSKEDDLDYVVWEVEMQTERSAIPASNSSLKRFDNVVILGHPGIEANPPGSKGPAPLDRAIGAIWDVNGHHNSIAHTARTAPGSSGSPIFSEEYKLKAIHHHRQIGENGHGIPIAAIAKDLRTKGFDFLG